ncbi:SRPBCC family protein [Dechloromonas sp. A34]|uniref:SRPBCC family protein n=1 Tax=Dechloromonas sp. A34 TaxID=447588 RepID=UPI002248E164|nr:SRPBCC family protein [Dechloromonas sp. A34]
MAEYRLQSVWRIAAPLEDVYAAVHDSMYWPDWWPGAEQVEALADGEPDGVDSVRRYAWRGALPYRLVVEVRVTRIEALVAIDGSASGDLDGVGRWRFSREGPVSIVAFEWHVRTTRWWMNLIAPFAHSVFVRNHALIMAQGGAGLAQRLVAPLLGKDTVDLLADAPALLPAGRRIDLAMAGVVGIAAGVIATVAQLVLWWLANVPVAETLLRDTRLTAALLMGPAVLPPPTTLQWDILLVATLIHFALSIAYAIIPAQLAGRLPIGPLLLIGGLYGLAIYAVNLYGFTLLFPWFVVARDWVTLLTHLVFGVTLFGGCRLFQRSHDSF